MYLNQSSQIPVDLHPRASGTNLHASYAAASNASQLHGAHAVMPQTGPQSYNINFHLNTATPYERRTAADFLVPTHQQSLFTAPSQHPNTAHPSNYTPHN